MVKARKASALVIGAMAAVAIGGGVAFASSGGDEPVGPSRAGVIEALTAEPSASASASAGIGAARAEIGADEARAIAVRAAGGGRVIKVERETEHGRAVWDVEVRRGAVEHDIDVDRRTGAVLRHEIDRDDASGRDDRGDARDVRDDRGGRDDRGDNRGDDHGGHGRGGDDGRDDDHGGRGRGGDD